MQQQQQSTVPRYRRKDQMSDQEHEHLLVRVGHDASAAVTATVTTADGGGSITLTLVLSIFTAVCGSFVCGSAMGYSSPAQSAIMKDLGLSTAEFSLFGSMLTVGGLLGSLVSGKITDRMGRRGSIALSDMFCLIGWVAIAFSQDAWSLDVGRFLLGFGMGLIVFAVPVYIAEVTPKNLRGGSVLLHQLGICCGIALVFLVGLITTWRFLALIGVLPCLMQLVGLLFIPESPRWLVNVGREKEYEAALRRLRGGHADISEEAADIKQYTESHQKISEASFLYMFQVKYAYALTVGLGLMALSAFAGTNGILYYAMSIFDSAGFSSTVGTIAMAIIQFPFTALGVFLMDKFGRRPLLLFSVSGMCSACLFLGLSFLMKDYGWMKDSSPYLALLGILVYSATFPVGMGGIPFVIMSEIFPINIKGAAGSLATVVNWSSAWIVSYAFNFMMLWSSPGTFFIFTGINAFSLLFVSWLVPETKGRTLEEIQESITHILR